MTNSTYTPSVHLFVDMDGTLVTWKQAACFEELLQENYFRDLPPYKEVVDAINWLNSTYPEIDVHVLSAYMPENPYSVNEKNEWLDTYLPAIPKANRIFHCLFTTFASRSKRFIVLPACLAVLHKAIQCTGTNQSGTYTHIYAIYNRANNEVFIVFTGAKMMCVRVRFFSYPAKS